MRELVGMPKFVEDLVDELLGQDDFYPDKSEDKRKDAAYGVAWKQYKSKRKPKESYTIEDFIKTAENLDKQGQWLKADAIDKQLNDLLK
jgi:hypothetical protein